MSHATGRIYSLEGKILAYFEYNGTVDVCCTRVFKEYDDMLKEWRKDNSRPCTCTTPGEPVILYTNYGKGYYWVGAVCWQCMAITEGILPIDEVDGEPFINMAEELL
jgi:hypothetical protein